MKLVVSVTALLLLLFDIQNVTCVTEYANEWAAEIKGGKDVAKRVATEHGYDIVTPIEAFPDHYLLIHSAVPKRSKRSANFYQDRLDRDSRVVWAEQQDIKVRVKRNVPETQKREFNDPEWKKQWYLATTSDLWNKRSALVYNATDILQRYTGKGVVVTILDDGIEWVHPDLHENYDPRASTDLNDNDADPTPRYESTNFNRHGTRCAGEVAMVANNKICGVGVAHKASIGGIRMLDGTITDALEARSTTFGLDHIDIMSSSWGPSDSGNTVEGPGRLTSKGILKGIVEGRKGKGLIYMWASGNGGLRGDSCACDGYASSIYTISISSASKNHKSPWYTELCASTLATAYSSGSSKEPMIVSSDIRKKCTESHSGTSAAAPLAAGIIALAIEANPALTWRDVQHLLVATSQHGPLQQNDGWYTNAAGYHINSRFGFGLIDVTRMLTNAEGWVNVGRQLKCVSNSTTRLPRALRDGDPVRVEVDTRGCSSQPETNVVYLEHAQIVTTIQAPRRGTLTVSVTSAAGTTTQLLPTRKHDNSSKGFQSWPFTSVHTWGENPIGTWTVTVKNTMKEAQEGQVVSVQVILYGTMEEPSYAKPQKSDVVSMTHPPKVVTEHTSKHHGRIKSNRNHRVRTSHGAFVRYLDALRSRLDDEWRQRKTARSWYPKYGPRRRESNTHYIGGHQDDIYQY